MLGLSHVQLAEEQYRDIVFRLPAPTAPPTTTEISTTEIPTTIEIDNESND